MTPLTYWDNRVVRVKFGNSGPGHLGLEVMRRDSSRTRFVLFQFADGVHIRAGDSRQTVVPRKSAPTPRNLAFVEMYLNGSIDRDSKKAWKWTEKEIGMRGALPETLELFRYYATHLDTMISQDRRNGDIAEMKALVRRIGDMTEDEMLEIWREARIEEVMKS